MIEILLDRIEEAGGGRRLKKFLKSKKEAAGARHRAFRASGALADIRQGAVDALSEGYLSLNELANLVDEIEENGAQHIFLFDEARIDEFARAAESLPPFPAGPTEAKYGATPRNQIVARSDERMTVIKQVRTVDYWVKNAAETEETAARRTVVYDRMQGRAVNLIRVYRPSKLGEIRISRVSPEAERLWRDQLLDLSHKTGVDLADPAVLRPQKVWEGFTKAVNDRAHTFMTTDTAISSQISHMISSRRDDNNSSDIRDLGQYDMAATEYTRDKLNIYWRLDDDRRVHTIMTRERPKEPWKGGDLSKIYVSERLDPSDVEALLERIRQTTC